MTGAPAWLWSLIGGQRDDADLYVRLHGLDWLPVHMRRTSRTRFASTHVLVWRARQDGRTRHVHLGRTPAEQDPFSPSWLRGWRAGEPVVLAAGNLAVNLDVGSAVTQTRERNPIARDTSAAFPCASCVFRNDQPGYVPPGTVESVLSMPPDMNLVCHESGGTRVCAGWRLFRIRAGLADDDPLDGLDQDAPVFGSVAELASRTE